MAESMNHEFLCSFQVDAEMVCHPIPQRGLDQVHLELQFCDFLDLPFAAEHPNLQEI